MNEEKREILAHAFDVSSGAEEAITDLTDSLATLFTAIVKINPEIALDCINQLSKQVTKEFVKKHRKERTKVADTLASFYLNMEK